MSLSMSKLGKTRRLTCVCHTLCVICNRKDARLRHMLLSVLWWTTSSYCQMCSQIWFSISGLLSRAVHSCHENDPALEQPTLQSGSTDDTRFSMLQKRRFKSHKSPESGITNGSADTRGQVQDPLLALIPEVPEEEPRADDDVTPVAQLQTAAANGEPQVRQNLIKFTTNTTCILMTIWDHQIQISVM